MAMMCVLLMREMRRVQSSIQQQLCSSSLYLSLSFPLSLFCFIVTSQLLVSLICLTWQEQEHPERQSLFCLSLSIPCVTTLCQTDVASHFSQQTNQCGALILNLPGQCFHTDSVFKWLYVMWKILHMMMNPQRLSTQLCSPALALQNGSWRQHSVCLTKSQFVDSAMW